MTSPQNSKSESQILEEIIIARITRIHASISKIDSLRPSRLVNDLFTHLVKLCTLPLSIDVKALPKEVQSMGESLIVLCGRAEILLELDFATFLNKIPQPLNNVILFPYNGNYIKLANLVNRVLKDHGVEQPTKVAFVGSGPMPLTSIILATHHMKSTHFDNFDIDEAANDVARRIVATDAELEKRMKFLTWMTKEEKVKILEHIKKYMKNGGVLLVRSAKGAKAFLYLVVEEDDLLDFEVLSIFHPINDVINSVVLVRKAIC
ncbi:hypothetical protein Patl1_14295 [Pistacia atlantica]|uniref:Uncharacterized protein n=1 Tax=Pistacia atlantica TaxID=434234 RepID=A0ACC1AWV3_9ROSI|nr:hypothetical protein Patl1_14295 [Pistacia atlantica]